MEFYINITCGICKNFYNDQQRKPLFLSCGDSVCALCLTQEIQPKQHFKCINCQQLHKDLQISQVPVNKQLLDMALKILQQIPQIICQCEKGLKVDYYCKKDDKLCCLNCYIECIEHKELIYKIPNIQAELENMKEILESEIIQKAQQLLNEVIVFQQKDTQLIFKGNQVHTLAKKIFAFLKEIPQIQPKTDYLSYLRLLNKYDEEQLLKNENELQQIKNKQIEIRKNLEVELENMKNQFQAFDQDKIIFEKKFNEIEKIRLELENYQQKKQDQQKQNFMFDSNKTCKDASLREENKIISSNIESK